MTLVKVISFMCLFNFTLAHRILLVFPLPSRSHAILGDGFVRHLLDAGHEVTYITQMPTKNTNPRLREIDVSLNNYTREFEKLFDIKRIINPYYGYKDIYQKLNRMADIAYGNVMHPNVQRLIFDTTENFDVVIAEWFLSELYSGFSSVFNCPLIWSCSMEPHSLMLSLIDDVLNPAYNPFHLSSQVPPFDFYGRVRELWILIKLYFINVFMLKIFPVKLEYSSACTLLLSGRITGTILCIPPQSNAEDSASDADYDENIVLQFVTGKCWVPEQLAISWWLMDRDNIYFTNAFTASVEKRGHTLPSFFDVKYNASLMFGNSHVLSGSSIRLPQNYIPIGGYHIKGVVDPLPSEIETILDNAQNGLIYFSKGSIAKSSSIPIELKKALLDVFSEINQTILWKFEEELPDLPKNVHIVRWAPQLGILAHRNCKLFITHGGLMSILESIHFGVPIIGIPLFGDHHLNVNRAVDKGLGKRVDLNNLIAIHMKAAIVEILRDDRFHKKIKEYSLVYHDWVIPPGKLIVYWVSHVIRTNGARHLRTPAFLIPWYKKIYLDLIAILITSYVFLRALIQALNRYALFRRKLYKPKIK